MKQRFISAVVSRLRLILALAVLLSAAAYVLPGNRRLESEVPAPSAARPLSSVSPSALLERGASMTPDRAIKIVDVFAARTWEASIPKAALPPPAPAMPASPATPPLPFRFFGRVIDSDRKTTFILIRGNETLMAHVGENIEPAYLVEGFDGKRLHFTYLPLNVRQTLFIGNPDE